MADKVTWQDTLLTDDELRQVTIKARIKAKELGKNQGQLDVYFEMNARLEAQAKATWEVAFKAGRESYGKGIGWHEDSFKAGVGIGEVSAESYDRAYKAGQKEAVMKVLDKLHLNEIDAYNWQDTTEKYPSLLAKTVKEIKKEWGIE
jgi:hypothetical protein